MKMIQYDKEPDYKLIIRLGIKKIHIVKEEKMKLLAQRVKENIEAAIREVIGDENLVGEVDDGLEREADSEY